MSDLDLESLVNEGLTASEIARRLNCTPQNVAQRLKRAGLKASKDPTRRKPREKGEQKIRVSGRVAPEVAKWAEGRVSELITESFHQEHREWMFATNIFEDIDEEDCWGMN